MSLLGRGKGARRLRTRTLWLIASALAVLVIIGAAVSWRQSRSGRSKDLADLAPLLEARLPKWTEEWRATSPGFAITAFRKLKVVPLMFETERPYAADDPMERLRQPLYVSSPDKSKFVDLFAKMELIKENKKLIAAFDVDTAVELVDVQGKIRRRLAFCGPACSFDDAAWLANDILVGGRLP